MELRPQGGNQLLKDKHFKGATTSISKGCLVDHTIDTASVVQDIVSKRNGEVPISHSPKREGLNDANKQIMRYNT